MKKYKYIFISLIIIILDQLSKYLINNKCSIYNKRPNICRGEYLYHLYFEGMDVEEYYKILHHYCNMIRGGKIDWVRIM